MRWAFEMCSDWVSSQVTVLSIWS